MLLSRVCLPRPLRCGVGLTGCLREMTAATCLRSRGGGVISIVGCNWERIRINGPAFLRWTDFSNNFIETSGSVASRIRQFYGAFNN